MNIQEFYKLLNQNYQDAFPVPQYLYNLALEILLLFQKIPNIQEKLEKISYRETMALMEKFLKENYSIDFQNAIYNNLYGEDTKIVMGVKKELEEIKYQLYLLKKQKQNHEISEKKYQKKKKKYQFELNLLYVVNKWNSSAVSPTGEMYLDIRQTIEDSFNILHESMHKLYVQPNDSEKVLPLGEIPSIAIEFQLYYFCLQHNLYRTEVTKYMKHRLIPLKENAIRIIMEYMIQFAREKEGYVTKEIMETYIEQWIDPRIHSILKKELKHNFNYENGYHISLWQYFSTYMKAYYISILINQKDDISSQIEYIGYHLHDTEKKVLRKLNLSFKNQKKWSNFTNLFFSIYDLPIEDSSIQKRKKTITKE